MEEEIDLRVYIDTLLKWWWLIALGALVVGAGAFAFTVLQPRMYEATAGVVSLRSRVEISLGSGFESVSENDITLPVQAANVVLDRNQRRLNTLTGMVRSGAIAQQVADELRDVLDEEDADPARLIEYVEGRVLSFDKGGESDTIQIVVTHKDPVIAAEIANAWARAFEAHVNAIYGEASYSPFADVSGQVVTAKSEYDQAQAAWVAFLNTEDRIAELQRQVAEDEAVIEKLRQGRQDSVAAVTEAQVEVQKRLLTTSVVAELDANLRVFEKQRDELVRIFDRDYARLRRFTDLLLDANLMRAQLLSGESVSNDALVWLSFKAKVFNTVESLPFDTLDITTSSLETLLSATDPLTQVADLDALISAMESEVRRLETSLQAQRDALAARESYRFLNALSAESLDMQNAPSGEALAKFSDWQGLLPYAEVLKAPLDQEITTLENHVRELRAEIVRLQGRKDTLQRTRDLAWSAYVNLLSKEQEIRIATTSSGSEVRFASPAVPPLEPVSSGMLLNTAIGLAVGLMGGVVGAFLFNYLGLDGSNPRAFWAQLTKKQTSASA
ncbi:MAG: GNVR domain-containing protein [Anaerolineae bacterium]